MPSFTGSAIFGGVGQEYYNLVIFNALAIAMPRRFFAEGFICFVKYRLFIVIFYRDKRLLMVKMYYFLGVFGVKSVGYWPLRSMYWYWPFFMTMAMPL